MTYEEQRKAHARAMQERHLAKVKKEKAWLAANPHIAAQQEREKEEMRKNRETLRMLKAMKDEELAHQKNNKKPKNAFALLMESDTEEEKEEEPYVSDKSEENTECIEAYTGSKSETVDCPKSEPVDMSSEKKKFVWADECDE
jgi:hypothetical protein